MKTKHNSLPNSGPINNICVLGWGLLGDTFIRVPVIEALERKYPKAHITILTDPSAARAFNPVTTNYQIVPFKRPKGFQLATIVKGLHTIRELRKTHFNLSVDLYNGGSSPLISYLLGARRRISFNHRLKLRLANNLLSPYPNHIEHWTLSLGAMLKPLGIGLDDIKKDTTYICDNDSRKSILHLFDDKETKYIGVNLGAGTPHKTWPVKNYVELLNTISSRINVTPVVFFNPGQEALSIKFISSYKGKAIGLEKLKFEQEAAALEKCDIIITGDTALMHLSTGVRTPVFALFLETRPENIRPDINPFYACLIEDADKEPVDGYQPLINKIPADYAARGFIDFTGKKLGWAYKEQT